MVGRTESDSGAPKEPLQYTGLFVAGLRAGIPWDVLVEMQLPRLVMMVDAAHPHPRKTKGGREVRDATQADIDAFF